MEKYRTAYSANKAHTKAVLEHLEKTLGTSIPKTKISRGHLVAVSSLAGLVGVPGRTAYSASKFAMTGFFVRRTPSPPCAQARN